MTEKIIIDTDPGIDDTMALFYALENDALDILGLTTVFGNVHTDIATRNALKLLEIAGRIDVPVAHGAQRPLTQPYHGPVPYIHGEDGLGNTNLPPPQRRPIDLTAAQFIVDNIMTSPGEITLVPIGPLTNIALAYLLQPEIADHVKRVVLMGGAALAPGNVNPAAEANIFNDPEAADVVFKAPWDITMVGLDITHKIVMRHDELALYGKSSKPTSQLINRMLPIYTDYAQRVLGEPILYTHDPTAISYLLHPALYEVLRVPLRVQLDGVGRGKTWVWTDNYDVPAEDFGFDSKHPVNVVVGADVPAVKQHILATV